MLLLATIQYLSFNFRNGCASHFLTTLPIGGRFLSYHFANDLFRMPNDPTLHIIMVCAGSGIAPFRAFWQHRKNKRGYKKTSAWLYYGCRYVQTFLYLLHCIVANSNACYFLENHFCGRVLQKET